MYYVLIEGGCLVPCIHFSFHLMYHHHIININPFHAPISCTINHHTKFHRQHHRNYIFHLSSPTKSTNQPKQNGPPIISRKKCLCTFIINKIFAINHQGGFPQIVERKCCIFHCFCTKLRLEIEFENVCIHRYLRRFCACTAPKHCKYQRFWLWRYKTL